MKIYVVRHGESWHNIRHEFSHKIRDEGLTPIGFEQASKCAAWLATKEIVKIYSSPLRRAIDTANVIDERIKVGVSVLESLREVNVGILEQTSANSDWDIHNRIIDAWKLGYWDLCFPSGESFCDLTQRIEKAMYFIYSECADSTVAVVSHGGAILALRYGLCRDSMRTDTGTGSIFQISATMTAGRLRYEIVMKPFDNHLEN